MCPQESFCCKLYRRELRRIRESNDRVSSLGNSVAKEWCPPRKRQKRYIRGARQNGSCNSFRIKKKDWWRRGESEYPAVLKTRNLLSFRDAQNAESDEIALDWNVSGTRDFHSQATSA